jgi:ParB-like chromosome segregation protein Spo0J
MIGTIKTIDAMRLVSANGRHNEPVWALVTLTRDSETYAEIVDSIDRHGILVPILIRDEEVCNGTHRVTAAFELGIEEIPFTDDPLIGWGNEFEWPEAKEIQNCE